MLSFSLVTNLNALQRVVKLFKKTFVCLPKQLKRIAACLSQPNVKALMSEKYLSVQALHLKFFNYQIYIITWW